MVNLAGSFSTLNVSALSLLLLACLLNCVPQYKYSRAPACDLCRHRSVVLSGSLCIRTLSVPSSDSQSFVLFVLGVCFSAQTGSSCWERGHRWSTCERRCGSTFFFFCNCNSPTSTPTPRRTFAPLRVRSHQSAIVCLLVVSFVVGMFHATVRTHAHFTQDQKRAMRTFPWSTHHRRVDNEQAWCWGTPTVVRCCCVLFACWHVALHPARQY